MKRRGNPRWMKREEELAGPVKEAKLEVEEEAEVDGDELERSSTQSSLRTDTDANVGTFSAL